MRPQKNKGISDHGDDEVCQFFSPSFNFFTQSSSLSILSTNFFFFFFYFHFLSSAANVQSSLICKVNLIEFLIPTADVQSSLISMLGLPLLNVHAIPRRHYTRRLILDETFFNITFKH